MLGRGVDQVLPHLGDPELRESGAGDARAYVGLAERAHGPIPQPASFAWPWGHALAVLDEVAPDARVINVETSVTRNADFAAGKAVHYRMSPGNLPAVTVAHPDVCVLANNHVLDFGRAGLADTLDALAAAGLPAAGACRDAAQAWQPVAVPVPGGRVVVFACGAASSGIPPRWGCDPRPLLAPPPPGRGLPRQARPVRLRRCHQRLRGHHRLRTAPWRSAPAVPGVGDGRHRHASSGGVVRCPWWSSR
jgi:poly-gamma-glutamate capsule biosynthesis protein CapA/YwtB (metallophosphatase superfamily)